MKDSASGKIPANGLSEKTSFANETSIQKLEANLPSCKEYFPNLEYISALKQKL